MGNGRATAVRRMALRPQRSGFCEQSLLSCDATLPAAPTTSQCRRQTEQIVREKRVECPKCSKAMSVGFLLDRGNSDRKRVGEWVEGLPEKSFWTGLSTAKRHVLPVTTYRCVGCGYLESYARG